MYFVYILQSKIDGMIYKGIAKDVQHRLYEHNRGENRSTKAKRPWKLVYLEQYNTRIQARNREKFFKSGEGRELIRQILNK
jgi:putative endonuclease